MHRKFVPKVTSHLTADATLCFGPLLEGEGQSCSCCMRACLECYSWPLKKDPSSILDAGV